MCSSDIFLGLLAILFPPLPVWVKRGICSADSIINILLCMLGFIPGLIHAWYIIAKFPDGDYEYERVPGQDSEQGRVTYVFVHGQPQPQPQPKGTPPNRNYGATSNGNNGSAPSGPSSTAAQAGSSAGGDGGRAPPTYAEAVKADNKVQTQD